MDSKYPKVLKLKDGREVVVFNKEEENNRIALELWTKDYGRFVE